MRWAHLAAIFALGCSTEVVAGTHAPTYHEEVAPLLAAHCVDCHDGAHQAPDLSTLEAVLAAAGPVRESLVDHTMPPFDAPAAECRPLTRNHALGGEDRALILAWLDGRRLPGDAPDRAPTRTPLRIDVSVDLATESTAPYAAPAGESTRCFVFDPVGAADLDPDDAAVAAARLVHDGAPGTVRWAILDHGLLDRTEFADLEAEDGAPGFTCPNLAWPVRSFFPVALWPGSETSIRHPPGTATRLRGGTPLVLRVGFRMTAPTEVTLAVEFEKSEGEVTLAEIRTHEWIRSVTAAVRDDGVAVARARVLHQAPGALRVHAIAPNLPSHRFLGARVERRTAGARCEIDVAGQGGRRWYEYREAFRMEAVELLDVSCRYDGADGPVTVGTGAREEPCASYLLVSPWLSGP